MEVDHETLHKTSSEGEIVEQDKKPSAMHTRLADIPGPPSASPDPKTVDIIKYYKQARVDHDFKLIESIRRNKEFGNPYILTKVVDHFKIDQLGSNYPKEIFDPEELNPTEFEESFKRRRTVSSQPASAPVSVPVPAAAAAAAPQTDGRYTATALAAAVAAINASVATSKKDPTSKEGEEKRRTKWG